MNYDGFCLAVCLSLFGSGPCAESTPLPSEQLGSNEPSQATPAGQAGQKSMRRHSEAANDMRKAAIAGQLADFKRAAAIIDSDGWTSPLRADPGAHVERVRRAARSAAASTALPEATSALGVIAAACSKCHEDVGGPRITEIVSAPAEWARNGDEAMIVHGAAEVALWQGLVFPSNDGWSIGARMLATAPELDSDVEEVSALAHRTVRLARDAVEVPRDARAEHYGRILATCAGCHSKLGVKPE